MRKILFRGKRVDNGEWVYGFLFQYKAGQVGIGQTKMTTEVAYSEPEYNDFEHINIRDLYCPKVIPETVGQYTGLTDKNDIMIFEGDIITDGKNTGCVTMIKDSWRILGNDDFEEFLLNWCSTSYMNGKLFKHGTVVGNIHDNPDLLGVE